MISVPANLAADGTRPWPRALVFLLLGLGLLIGGFFDTVAGMVNTWWRSDTFAHGIVIYPISLWLVWRDRDRLIGLQPTVTPLAVAPFALLVVAWWLGRLADAQVVQEGALVGMVAALVWLFLGTEFVKRFWFALTFTLFAVPFGEGLIPLLMEYTATFTVGAVKLVGIPIFRDGMMFSLPSGDFQVAKACSGIRYLIASTALGTLYAYLTYVRPWRRLVFVAAAIIVPIIANGFRAFGIVMIAHYSQMRYAVGLDHLIYGWVFFGVVVFLLFWVGAFFAEAPAQGADGEIAAGPVGPQSFADYATARGVAMLAAVGVSVALALAASHALTPPASGPRAAAALPIGQGSWEGPFESTVDWTPYQPSADRVLQATYRLAGGGTEVELAIAIFDPLGRAGDVTSAANAVAERGVWNGVSTTTTLELPGSAAASVNRSIKRGPSGEYVFLQWFAVGEARTHADSVAAFTELRNALAGRHPVSASIVVAAPRDVPDAVLVDFISAFGDVIGDCATRVEGQEALDACALGSQ
ncbi:MAG: exosortase A [Pseudomonadota bacterium]